jgi:tRNA (guanine-N7-)-methyltransferase
MSDNKKNNSEGQPISDSSFTTNRLYAKPDLEKIAAGEHYLNRIKSFVLRTGRLTPGQAKAIENLGPEFLLPYTGQVIDWSKAFQSAETSKLSADANTPQDFRNRFWYG